MKIDRICLECGKAFQVFPYKIREGKGHYCSKSCKYQATSSSGHSERFWKKVDRSGPDDCWEWKGAKANFGYGEHIISNRKVRAHRVAWELTKGTIPIGLCILHKCDNPPCCNPNHLFVGTRADNSDDKIAKGRYRHGIARGEHHGQAILCEEDVLYIRATYNHNTCSQRSLATKFNVTVGTISAIVHRRLWKHVQDEANR